MQEDEEQVEVTQEQKDEAQKIVESALETERSEFVGAWGDHIEFYIERDGKTGYALVCDNKIIEYSLMREDDAEHTDVDEAERLALEAKACGFDHLTVKWSVDLGKSVGVIMCKSYGGALATDDCANAVVSGGEVVAFSAGKCETEHKDIPSVKKTEREARRATKDGDKGTLVVRNINAFATNIVTTSKTACITFTFAPKTANRYKSNNKTYNHRNKKSAYALFLLVETTYFYVKAELRECDR